MVFRTTRKFPTRRATRRFPTRFRRTSSFARKKYDKVMIYDTLQSCTPNAEPLGCLPAFQPSCNFSDTLPGTNFPICGTTQEGVPCRCCRNLVTIQLMNNDFLQSQFNDKLVIKSLFGFIKFRHLLSYPLGTDRCTAFTPTPDQIAGRYAEVTWAGIHKSYRSQTGEDNIDGDQANLQYAYDYTETPWIWKRTNHWQPTARVKQDTLLAGSVIGICSDTTSAGGGSLVNTLAAGSGNINTNVAATATNCNKVRSGTEETPCDYVSTSVEVSLPPWHTFPILVRKPIVLRGDVDLNLQLSWFHPQANELASAGWGCDPNFTNEHSSLEWHARIAAVLQLN